MAAGAGIGLATKTLENETESPALNENANRIPIVELIAGPDTGVGNPKEPPENEFVPFADVTCWEAFAISVWTTDSSARAEYTEPPLIEVMSALPDPLESVSVPATCPESKLAVRGGLMDSEKSSR